MLVVEFVTLFLIILVLGYLMPAGKYYYWYYVRNRAASEHLRIQERRPSRKEVWREVKMSLVSVVIFAALATVLFELYKVGGTSIYWRFRDYPLGYFPLSFLLCLVFHDTYFYWTHRFMHWRPVFKYFHLGHHRSLTPTPWAIYAFQPLEAVTQFLGVALLVIFLPLHPLALLLFLWYDTEVNTAGHTGYEVVPDSVARHWLFRGLNTARHHDAHHTNTRVNFGSFFNVWDRWMGTFQDSAPAIAQETKPYTRTKSARRLPRSPTVRRPAPRRERNYRLIRPRDYRT
jgi:Delta7-sterol 5-desaturase